MKYRLLILYLLLSTALAAQAADTLHSFNTPQFSSPIYDFFARNYLGVEAAGRGYTGISILSSAQNNLLNPASMIVDSARVFTELSVKPPLSAEGIGFNSRYSSPIPLALLGFSFPLGSKLAAAVSYNNPKSIILDDFSIEINQGADLVTRYPTYYLHQLSASLAYHPIPKLHLGLSLHNQLHYLDDLLFLRSYDRIREYNYSLRVQPGIIFTAEHWGAGLTATLPTSVDWELKYAQYSAQLPLEVALGTHYSFDHYRVAADLHFRNDAAIVDDFKDHVSVHLGAEKRVLNNIYRFGYFYSSDVFSGIITLPVNTTAQADTSIFWNDVSPTLPISDTSQHFVSLGFGHHFRDGSINVSLMHALVGEYRQTQLNLSLNLYLSSFRRKDFLRYE